MPKNYSQKEFEKDLQELELLIKNSSKKNLKGGNMHQAEQLSDSSSSSNSTSSTGMSSSSSSSSSSSYDDMALKQEGGKISKGDKVRHFSVCQLNGKNLEIKDEIGDVRVKSSPLNAAKKLYSSIAKHMKLKGNAKYNLKVTFMIRESTRGKRHNKMYGPYHGSFKKYNAEEAKKAEVKLPSGKIQKYKGKAVVKLAKHKVSHQKGGK